MASIVLRNFGGMAPSANSKSLPEAAATYVQNLDLRFGDFRPLAQPANMTTATAGASLYKMEGATGFITRPGTVNFVRGPIPNDPTERTYYTGDGAPKVIDLTGEVRQLGVPQPAAAPTVQAIVNDEFSEADAVAARNETLERIKYAVRGGLGMNSITGNYVGLTSTDLGDKFITGLPSYALGVAYAAFNIPGSMSGSGFIPANPAHNNLNDPRLDFRLMDIDGTLKAIVPLMVSVDSPAVGSNLRTYLLAIEHPVTYSTFIKPEMADSIVANIQERIKVPNTNRDQCLERMRQLVKQFIAVADMGDTGTPLMFGQVQAFYARTDINSIVEAAITRATSATFSAMQGYTGGDGNPLPL